MARYDRIVRVLIPGLPTKWGVEDDVYGPHFDTPAEAEEHRQQLLARQAARQAGAN